MGGPCCPIAKVILYGWSMLPRGEAYTLCVVHAVPVEKVILYGWSMLCQ